MDGDSAPGSGATPGPGSGSTSGPVPATPAEVKAVEDELLGIVVDGPRAGGLGRDATRTTRAAPSSRPPTADDVAAYVGLVELSQPTPPLPGVGPVGSTRRLGRLLVASGLMGLFGVFLLLAVMQSRSGGGDAGDGSTTGAGGPAASVQQGGAAQPSVDEAQPGAGGGAGQPDTADLAGCRVDDYAVSVAVRNVKSQTGINQALDTTWDLVFTNESAEPVAIVFHRQRSADTPGAAPSAGWDDGWQEVAPGQEYAETRGSEWTRFPGSESGVDDGLRFWKYVDRMAVFRATPACSWIGGDEAALEKLTSGVPEQPLGE